jgi:hypothetical protein
MDHGGGGGGVCMPNENICNDGLLLSHVFLQLCDHVGGGGCLFHIISR